MKKFILHTLAFLALSALLVALFHLLLLRPRKQLFTLPGHITTAYLGNSTVECAVNDSLLPGAFNFGAGAETLDYVYAKIKSLKQQNPALDTIVIATDDILLFKTSNFNGETKNIYFIDTFTPADWYMNLKEYTFNKIFSYIRYPYSLAKIKHLIKARRHPESVQLNKTGIGGYIPLYQDQLAADMAERHAKGPAAPKNIDGFPAVNRYYLDRIVAYCHDRDMTLLYLTTPKHQTLWNDTVYREIHRRYYPQIPLIDCTRFAYPDSCFGDCIHLNHKGARIFTQQLTRLIRRSACTQNDVTPDPTATDPEISVSAPK
ncbi:MAG: hypothetical protein J1E02_01380 [Coprobacter sp.]|nr:hypothetical protein [Coprobacter sp.]